MFRFFAEKLGFIEESEIESKITKKFNFKENIPKTENAKQIFLENPDQVFIGVYNARLKNITLMPAMKKFYSVTYSGGKMIKAVEEGEPSKELNKTELKELNENYKNYIPRFADFPDSNLILSSHEMVLLYKLSIDKNNYYGFTVTPRNGHPKFVWTSSSLNASKSLRNDKIMPKRIQKEVEKIIFSWIPPKKELREIPKPSGHPFS